MRCYLDALLADFNDITIFSDRDMLLRNTKRVSQFSMQHQLTVLTVHGHKVPGAYQREHQLQFFLRGMTRYMHIRDALVEYLSALSEQTIDRPMHHFLIARYRRS